jgi:prepilin-type N-terminal cleavage/methylation domain-containing protein
MMIHSKKIAEVAPVPRTLASSLRRSARASRGFSLVEIMIVSAMISAVILLAGSSLGRWQDVEKVKSAARAVEGAFARAHGEAIRTGNNHIVFLETDIVGDDLENNAGEVVSILILDDGRPGSGGQNCDIDVGEPIETITLRDDITMGPTASTAKVDIDDGATAFGDLSTFSQTGGAPATWVLFRPDGTPRSIDAACTQGPLGSGGGAIYLSNAEREVSVVLSPLGASRAFAWNGSSAAWN